MPLSYLAVLKRSLFTAAKHANAPQNDQSNSHDLKEDWIYIHDGDNSQTEEIVDLNDQNTELGTLSGANTLTSELDEQKQREILLNRDLWVQKQHKKVKSLKMAKSSSKVNRSKIMKRKRNSNSVTSQVATGKINQNNQNLPDTQDKISVNSLENQVNSEATEGVASQNYSTQPLYHTRKNHYYLEANGHASNKNYKKIKTMSCGKKNRVINQPMAKGLC